MKRTTLFSTFLRWAVELAEQTTRNMRADLREKRNLAELARLDATLLQDIALSEADRNALSLARQKPASARFEYWSLFPRYISEPRPVQDF